MFAAAPDAAGVNFAVAAQHNVAFRAAANRVVVAHQPANSVVFRPAAAAAISSGPPTLRPASPKEYQQSSMSVLAAIPLGAAYHADVYSLAYTISDGTVTRPILNIDDLRDFNRKQSEFTELKALGDIGARYPSLSRAFVGVLSKTVVVIPARYALMRSSQGLPAKCEALVDSAASGTSKCKFDFMFLLAADVSPIDLIQFTQDIGGQPELANCSVVLPAFLKEGKTPTFSGGFSPQCSVSPMSTRGAFVVTIEIRDEGDSVPAVASANLLIRQLSSDIPPFLSGTLPIKLDDDFPNPIEATFALNFHETSGSDELTFAIDEAKGVINFINRSPVDLVASRAALCKPASVSVVSIESTIPAHGSIQLPLPADHPELKVLVERELQMSGPIPAQDLDKFMLLEAQDVQNTQYSLGLNASSVDFHGRNLDAGEAVPHRAEEPSAAGRCVGEGADVRRLGHPEQGGRNPRTLAKPPRFMARSPPDAIRLKSAGSR
jgi:hypothetical protein